MMIPPAPAPNALLAWDVFLSWMSRQRWFANKGAEPTLEQIGSWELDSADPEVRLVTHLLLDHAAGASRLYQVPLSYRRTALEETAALIGRLQGWFVYDAAHDQAYPAALLELVHGGRRNAGERMWARGTATGPAGLRTPAPAARLESRVLSAEQSNTSIVIDGAGAVDGGGAAALICKVFRTIHDGENPDVVLQTALAAAGSEAVPAPVGSIIAEWNDRGQPGGRARGHLVFVQEYLAGAQDGWSLALDAARSQRDFGSSARALGLVTAEVHASLAAILPSRPPTGADIAAAVAQMDGRLVAAIGEVPALRAHAPALREVFARAAQGPWPVLQRIHGDLHLGQALTVPGRGWLLVDFEGEPLRPMLERSHLDSPLRDVAGMLRSLDYAAGSLAVTETVQMQDWAAAARAGFRAGYSAAWGRDIRDYQALVDAFELDKALYEVAYEARNRPAWLPIPVAAIQRIARRLDPAAS